MSRLVSALAMTLAMLLAGCHDPFHTDEITTPITQEQLRMIDTTNLEAQSLATPITVEEATEQALERGVQIPEPPSRVELTISDVRADALRNNLDLHVELINPSIAAESVNEEEAKFESVFFAGYRRAITDSPTALATEGSQTTFDSATAGFDVPLRTGGAVRIELPVTRTETNNPFSLLDPAFTSDARFSISQPLLRNGGFRVNSHSIRVAKYQERIVDAQTKLEAIRILANADRAYWLLYAARRELDVRLEQYELAKDQLERARRKVDAGDVAGIEITRAESGVASTLEAIIIAYTQLKRRQRDLLRIINRDDLPLDADMAVIPLTEPSPVGLELNRRELALAAIANRMEMLELELLLAIDASTIDFEKNLALPLFTVDYTYSANGLGSSFGNSFDQLADKNFEDWSVGLNVEIPIGNEAAEARVRRALLTRLQRLATREQREQAIASEVFDALDTLRQNWQRIIAARHETILAGRTYEAEQRQFDVGERTSTDVLNAATDLADAQSREVSALAEYQIAQVDLAFATGTLLGSDRIDWQPIGLEDEQSTPQFELDARQLPRERFNE
jgi:outer membrane protein TolC